MTTLSIPVFGMTCERCEAKVAGAIEALGAGVAAQADRQSNQVTISGPVDEKAARQTILSLGYQLEDASSPSSQVQLPPLHPSRNQPDPHLSREKDDVASTARQAASSDGSAVNESSFDKAIAHELRAREVFLDIEGMSCAACASAVTAAIKGTPGVEQCEVNFAAESAWVLGRIDAQDVIRQVKRAGYEALETTDDVSMKQDQQRARFRAAVVQASLALTVAAGLMTNMLFGWLAWGVDTKLDIALALGTLWVMFVSGRTFYRKAWVSLSYHRATMDTLVALSTGTAWVYSSWSLFNGSEGMPSQLFFEAALFVIGFVRLGKALEMRARANALAGLDELIRLAPQDVIVVEPEGQSRSMPLSDVMPDQTVRVLPGARIPLDGRVLKGETEIDTSLISGESLPVLVKVGDHVQGGCLNLSHPIDLLVSHPAKEGSLAQMVRALKRAQNAKPAIADQIDTITQYFVPAIVLLSSATLALWWGVLGATPHFAVNAALCVLIVACPCALGLAVPMSLVNAIGVAARRGLVLRRGDALLIARQLSHLLLDKTGTLTKGRLRVTHHLRIEGNGGVLNLETEGFLLALAGHSEHPIAKAVATFLTSPPTLRHDDHSDLQAVSEFEVEDVVVAPGLGLCGVINGHQIAMGNGGYLGSLEFDVDSIEARLATGERAESIASSGPVTYWGISGQVLGQFQLTDEVRDEAAEVVRQLRAAGIEPIIVSGDRAETVEQLASRLDQVGWQAQQSPEQKLAMVQALKSQSAVVGMAGDGMNDGPALAAAHVSFAMSEGTVLASEQADVTLTSGLQGIVDLVQLSEAVHANIRQNLVFAFGYNLALIPVASGVFFPLTGWLLSPSFAGLAMALSSVSVVLNAARLNRRALLA